MKNISTLGLFLIIHSFVFSQSINDYKIDVKGNNHLNIIDTEENENAKKIYAIGNYECRFVGEKTKTDVNVNILSIYSLVDNECKNESLHILAGLTFPKDANFELKKGQIKIANQTNMSSIDQILEQYPNLSDNNMESYFHSNETPYYKSEIETNLYSRIETFTSALYGMKESNRSGVVGKLSRFNKKIGGSDSQREKMVASDKVSLNWEDNYNGGQSKKDYWKNIFQASDPISGNLIAINHHYSKADKALEFKSYEFVVFNNKGEEILKKELNFDIAWKHAIIQPYFIENKMGSQSPQSVVMVFTQNSNKKINPNPNKAQIKVLNLSAKGEVLFDDKFDLPKDVKYVSGIAHHSSEEFVIHAAFKGHRFLAECGPNHHFSNSFELGLFDDPHNLIGYSIGDEYNYVIFDNQLIINNKPPETPATQFFMYATKQNEISERIVIPFEVELAESANCQFNKMSNGKNILMTKVAGKGINNFNYTLTASSFYSLKGTSMNRIDNSNYISYAFPDNNANSKINTVINDNSMFFIGGKFIKDKNNDLLWQNCLIEIAN